MYICKYVYMYMYVCMCCGFMITKTIKELHWAFLSPNKVCKGYHSTWVHRHKLHLS